MLKRSLLVIALMTTVALPAGAQDIATRIFNIENQLRQLTGQIEELNHALQQLQKQAGSQQGAAEQAPDADKAKLAKKMAEAPADAGSEAILDGAPATGQPSAVIIGGDTSGNGVAAAPVEAAPKLQAGVNGEPALGEEPPAMVAVAPGVANAAAPAVGADAAATGQSSAEPIEQVSLNTSADTPESVYERGIESLLRRQFGEAEGGFRTFLQKYPEHNLAGSAQFQLGETFYAQGDFRTAAQNYLQAYKTYPKSRRAPDSLLKLGVSLGKLGQKEQACAALNSVSTEFPKATEAKKRAQVEIKRAAC